MTRLYRKGPFLAVFFLLGGSAFLAEGAEFYVDGSNPACSDSGPGAETFPYCTISGAVDNHSGAGTTILVKPGTYREHVEIPSSGTAGFPFVIQALGPGVLVDGADDLSSAALWTPLSGDVWYAAGVTWTPLQIFFDNARLTASLSEPASLPPGSFRFVSGEGLYVNGGGDNPGTHEILVGRRQHGFELNARRWVVIDGFTIRRTEERSIRVRAGSDDVRISNNIISDSGAYGIGLLGSSRVQILSNVVSRCNDHGIYLSTGTNDSIIQDNESFLNARPTSRAANGLYLGGSSRNLIQRNRLHHNQDSGLNIYLHSNDNVCRQNLSWSNGDHGFDHVNSTGTLHVGEVAWGNVKSGFSIEGNATGTRVHDCIAVDNGLTRNESNLFVEANSTAGFVSDDNIFWNSTSQKPIRYAGIRYATIAAFTAATGHDSQSIQADPMFVNPATGDFHLLAPSPAIDSGNSSVPGWPVNDAENRLRVDVDTAPNTGVGPWPYADRGALEFGGTCNLEVCDGLDNDCDGTTDDGFDVGAPCSTEGTGACATSGALVCAPDGSASVCDAVPGSPSPEICDGIDNDCNGTTDEGDPGGGALCGSGTGECVEGTTRCADGALSCVGSTDPAPEICDGLDNDCNGSADEGFDVGVPCVSGIGACARSGTVICVADGSASVCDAAPGSPAPEICDGLDNDCDGTTDDGFDVGAPCSTEGTGACATSGALVCAPDGSASVCDAAPGSPAPEICDGIDNDCNGTTDEGDPGGGAPCGSGTGECVEGTTHCADGALSCVGSTGPATEICDGLDNDCDDATDEGFDVGAPCTAGIGACTTSGALVCAPDGSASVCDAAPGSPSPEICDGIDNDCDGTTDNAAAPTGAAQISVEAIVGTTRISWGSIPAADLYDVVRGELVHLHQTAGSFSDALCLTSDTSMGSANDPESPAAGDGFWYLVRGLNCAGAGSYDSTGLLQANPRDARIAASASSCP